MATHHTDNVTNNQAMNCVANKTFHTAYNKSCSQQNISGITQYNKQPIDARTDVVMELTAKQLECRSKA